MNKYLLAVALAIVAGATNAADDKIFERCVQIKDLTLAIAKQADQGVSRTDMKAKAGSAAVHPLIDFVYDFRGVKTNQEIAANQMESCLRLSSK